MREKRISTAEEQSICELYHVTDLSIVAIAKKVGVSDYRAQACIRRKYPKEVRDHRRGLLTAEQQDKAKALFEDTSLTMEEIASSVGATRKQIHGLAHDNFSEDYLQGRKRGNYRESKIGDKNPMKGKTGEDHHNYVGEVEDGRGYLMVIKPEWYTGRPGSKHVFQHSVVFCENVGLTEIPPGFCVHHVDGDRKNNNINNLALLRRDAHQRLHHRERATTISKESKALEGLKRVA